VVNAVVEVEIPFDEAEIDHLSAEVDDKADLLHVVDEERHLWLKDDNDVAENDPVQENNDYDVEEGNLVVFLGNRFVVGEAMAMARAFSSGILSWHWNPCRSLSLARYTSFVAV
jgi:hypothetical protein